MYQDLRFIEELFSDIFKEPIHLGNVVEIKLDTKPKKDPEKKRGIADIARNWTFEDEPKPQREPRQVNWETLITPERVIFNEPATIVFWSDGTKTTVKCHKDDGYDKEKGLAMAFMKRMYGNDGYFNEIIKKWCPYNVTEQEVINEY